MITSSVVKPPFSFSHVTAKRASCVVTQIAKSQTAHEQRLMQAADPSATVRTALSPFAAHVAMFGSL